MEIQSKYDIAVNRSVNNWFCKKNYSLRVGLQKRVPKLSSNLSFVFRIPWEFQLITVWEMQHSRTYLATHELNVRVERRNGVLGMIGVHAPEVRAVYPSSYL